MMKILTKPLAENIVSLKNVSWNTFNHLLDELSNHRSERFTYYLGVLQIMSPLGIHESNNRFIESLIFVMAEELNLNLKKFGSLTLKSKELSLGVEPDSCYYITNEPKVRNKQNIDLTIDPPPDLVLEIDITSGSLNKLPIYANLKVPEIWRYDGERLTVYSLNTNSNEYQELNQSPTFPWLDLSLIPQLILQSLEDGETATLKQFRQKVKNKNY